MNFSQRPFEHLPHKFTNVYSGIPRWLHFGRWLLLGYHNFGSPISTFNIAFKRKAIKSSLQICEQNLQIRPQEHNTKNCFIKENIMTFPYHLNNFAFFKNFLQIYSRFLRFLVTQDFYHIKKICKK